MPPSRSGPRVSRQRGAPRGDGSPLWPLRMRIRNASGEVSNHGNEDDASEHGNDDDAAEHGNKHDATERGDDEVALLRCARRLRLP